MNCMRLIFFTFLFGIYAISNAAPPQVQLSVSFSGNGNGIVESEQPGIICPSDCDETYKKGATVTLTATADSYSSFIGWDGACAGTDPTCVLKLMATTNVIAQFDAVAVEYPNTVPKTGQTICYDPTGVTANEIDCTGTGQDGEYQAGTALPDNPRFSDNGDGTLTDNSTGLIWLQQKNCLHYLTWAEALAAVNSLGSGQCGLTDQSQPGEWRLPNIRELESTYNYSYEPFGPGFIWLQNHSCGSAVYWSSTTPIWSKTWAFTYSPPWIQHKPKNDGTPSSRGCALAVRGGL